MAIFTFLPLLSSFIPFITIAVIISCLHIVVLGLHLLISPLVRRPSLTSRQIFTSSRYHIVEIMPLPVAVVAD